MATQVLVPVMGEAIGEARLSAWLKAVGDPVRRGDELAELETDKAVLMLECPADGVLLEILAAAGAMVTTGQLLAQVGKPGEQAPVVAASAGSRPIGPIRPIGPMRHAPPPRQPQKLTRPAGASRPPRGGWRARPASIRPASPRASRARASPRTT